MASQWTGTADVTGVIGGIPDNILRLHTNDVLFEAMPVMRYDQFAVVKTDLQAEPGDGIIFSKYGNLKRGGQLSEEVDLVTNSMKKTTVVITVTEYGNAVGLTAKFLTLSFMEEMENASTLLGRDYAIVTDCMLRDAVFSGTNVMYTNSDTEQKECDTALALADIDIAITTLATKNILKFVDGNGEYYVGVFHPHQTKTIKTGLISIRQYAYPEMIFKGEVGEYMNVRFIETSNVPNGADSSTNDYSEYADPAYTATLANGAACTGGTNKAILYKGVIFGERAYGWAIALPVELREDPGAQNFGRKKGLAWYSIMGAGKINNDAILVIFTA